MIEETLRRLRESQNWKRSSWTPVVRTGRGNSLRRLVPALSESAKGRARQLNAGAAAATGPLLFFLHADTRLPEGFEGHIRDTLGQPGVVAGAFELEIQSPRRSLRIIETLATFRSRYLQLPYGDQGLFMRVEAFHGVGGFPELPIMEDFELASRLRRRGRIVIAPARVATSPRRWQRLGPWRVTWMNQLMVLGYYLGVSPDRLAKWYHGSGR